MEVNEQSSRKDPLLSPLKGDDKKSSFKEDLEGLPAKHNSLCEAHNSQSIGLTPCEAITSKIERSINSHTSTSLGRRKVLVLQPAYKPGSVITREWWSVIYPGWMLPPNSSVLPCSSDEQPSGATIHELAASKMHSRCVTTGAGGLLPHLLTLTPSSILEFLHFPTGRLFSSALLNPRGLLLY